MTALNDADAPGANTPPRPIRHFFWAFVLALTVPGLLSGIALAWWSAQELVEDQQLHARDHAANSAQNMGNHLKPLLKGLSALAQLPLDKDNFPDFYNAAKGFAAYAGYNVTLADGDGNQLMSTRPPPGTKLPRREAMDSVRKVIASGHPHVSEVFLGKMADNYVVAVDVPVLAGGGARVITLSADASAIAKVLLGTTLPDGWLTGLIDERGIFIARSKDPGQWVGKPTRPELLEAARGSVSGMLFNTSVEGFPILNVFHRVPGTEWTVVVGSPESVLYAPVMLPVSFLIGVILLATALAAGLAFVFQRRLIDETGDSARRHHATLSALSEGVVTHGRDGAIIASNPAAERILDLTGDQLRGLHKLETERHYIHEDGTPFPPESHPSAVVLRNGVTRPNVIMGIVKEDGVPRWILVNAAPMFNPGEDLPAFVVVSFSDITERRHAETALELERGKLAAAFENSAVGFILSDAQGRNMSMNATALALFG